MKKYLAFDGINGGHEDFDTIEEARKWLEDCFLSPDEGYHPDFQSCKIYQLAETVECEVVDKKENYKYMDEDDIPEGDNESQAWPYSTDFDEIWKHKFVADKMVSNESAGAILLKFQSFVHNYMNGFVFDAWIIEYLKSRDSHE